MPRPWKAIVAMAENRAIGRKGFVPWNIPEDLKFLKETTRGGVFVMGRTTFESCGKPLPYAHHTIVVSSTMQPRSDVDVVRDIAEIENYPTDRTLWSFGGPRIYAAMLPRVDDLFVTHVHQVIEDGDSFMPPFEDSFTLVETLQETDRFHICRYRNNALPESS